MAFQMGLLVLMMILPAAAAANWGEFDTGMLAIEMEPESAQRLLAGKAGYISYAALARNRVPCDQRGASYYNCRGHQRANPYTRGCTRATNCARTTR